MWAGGVGKSPPTLLLIMPLEDKIPAEEFSEQMFGVAAELLGVSCAPVFAAMLPVIRQGIELRFETATTPDLNPWPARKPNPKDDGHPLLIDTGALIAAAIGQGTGAIEQVSSRELVVGIDGQVIEYANVHNEGYEQIPQREYFGLDDQTIDQCEELIADYIMQKVFGNNEGEVNVFRDAA